MDKVNIAIEEIKLGIEIGADIEYYTKIYDNIWSLVRWNALTIENDVFYRARIAEKSRLFSNINELKYPLPNVVKQQGRLNDIGESIAYLSISEISPLVELDIDFYEIFCMAEVEYKLKNIFFFCIGIKGDYDGITRQEHDFINLFNHLLTTPDKGYYNATIAFAQKIFKSGLFEFASRDKKNIGIAYNSAQEVKTNKLLHNIAVQPEVFEQCFKIKKATYQLMSFNKKENNIIINDINSGSILDNGTIKWKRTFEEMMNYCKELFGKDIYITSDENGKNTIVGYPQGSGRIKTIDDFYYYVDFKKYGLTKINRLIVK